MADPRHISYTGRSFSKIKDNLIEYAKNYFPDTYQDFSAASPGMMFIEMAAYVGDVLSYYQDAEFQESFLQYAKNPSSLYALAYMMGYKPRVTSVSQVKLTVNQKVPATVDMEPDWEKACRIGENSVFGSTDVSHTTFLLKEPVDFRVSSSYDPTSVYLFSDSDSETGYSFWLSKKVDAYSGEIRTKSFLVGNYEKYRTLQLVDDNIVGILDIQDSTGEDNSLWTEVPFLGQDTVFEDTLNIVTEQGNQAPYTLRLKKVPKRFVTRFKTDSSLEIQFGAGMYAEDVDEQNFLPNPVSLAEIQDISRDRYDIAYDPSNFLFSKSYGLCPTNTTLTVRYVVGGGIQSNVPAYSIVTPITINVERGTVSLSDLQIYNEEPATGGRDGDSLEELRQNSLRSFAEQKRVVTLNDFTVRALAMPPKYGSVAKAYSVKESVLSSVENSSLLKQDPLAVTLYVLSYDNNGHLIPAGDTVKNNLKTYLSEYMMLTDTIDIKDAFVINIGIKYDIVLRPRYRASDVLLKCSEVLKDYFSTEKRTINEVINLSEVYAKLDQVQGVQTVRSIKLENKQGNGYSEFGYDLNTAVKDNIVYPSYDPCIFEVKYPDTDIEGRVTSL